MRLPVIHKTAWIHPGNRPEKVTAKATRVAQSQQGSLGGRAIHMVAHGIHAVMKGPRQHVETAVVVPMHAAPPPNIAKRTRCPVCAEWFPSRNRAERHARECSRIQVAVIEGVS